MYYKCNGTKWSSIVDKCREKDIDMVEIIFHTKYPVNVPRWFGFTDLEVGNMEAALVLEDFECDRVILSYIKPDIFTDDEWDYLLPYLEENGYLEGLLGKSASILSLTLDEIKEREEGTFRLGSLSGVVKVFIEKNGKDYFII